MCHECSNRTAVVKGYNQPVRVCNDCYPHCFSDSTLQTDDALPNIPTLDGQNDPDTAFPPLSPTHLHHWVLIPSDPHYNLTIRKAFYYNRTPNTTLFLSLLDLIKNKKLAAAFILDCCRTVSLQLMPDSTYSDEIDHNFVIELVNVCVCVCVCVCEIIVICYTFLRVTLKAVIREGLGTYEARQFLCSM